MGKFLLDWSNGNPRPFFDYWALTRGGYHNVPWGTDEGKLTADYTTTETRRQALRILDNNQAGRLTSVRPLHRHPGAARDVGTRSAVRHRRRRPLGQRTAVFDTDRSDKPPWVRHSDWTYEQSAEIRTNQLRTLKSVDDMVAAVMGRLDELGEGANTVSMFTSDNGYQWSEHGLSSKYHPYNHSTNVPFMLRWPERVPAGHVDRRLVGNVDITPSLLAAAGVTPQLKYPLDGIPFLSATGLAAATRSEAYLEFFEDLHRTIPDWASIRTEEHQYIGTRATARSSSASTTTWKQIRTSS